MYKLRITNSSEERILIKEKYLKTTFSELEKSNNFSDSYLAYDESDNFTAYSNNLSEFLSWDYPEITLEDFLKLPEHTRELKKLPDWLQYGFLMGKNKTINSVFELFLFSHISERKITNEITQKYFVHGDFDIIAPHDPAYLGTTKTHPLQIEKDDLFNNYDCSTLPGVFYKEK